MLPMMPLLPPPHLLRASARRLAGLYGLLTLAACATPERCARRYPPQLVARERTVTDTVIVTRGARLDTALSWRRDTLLIERPRLQLRLVRQRDTLRLSAHCAPDTVRIPVVREVVREVLRVAPAPPLWRRPEWGWLLAAGLALLLLRRAL